MEDITLLTKGKQASSVRIRFPHPEADGQSLVVGGGGQIGIPTATFEDGSGREVQHALHEPRS